MLFREAKLRSFRDFQMRVDTFEDQILDLIAGIDLTSDAVRSVDFDFKNLVSNLESVLHSDDDFHVGESIMEHMKMVLQNVNELTEGWDEKRRNMLRLTAFLHDIAKPETFEMRNNKATFYGHPERGYDVAKILLDQFDDEAGELREQVALLVKYHHSLYQLTDAKSKLKNQEDPSYLKGFIRAGLATQESLKDLSTFAMADSMTPTALKEVKTGIKIITEDVLKFKELQTENDAKEAIAKAMQISRLKDIKKVTVLLEKHSILDISAQAYVLTLLPDLLQVNKFLGQRRDYKALKALKFYLDTGKVGSSKVATMSAGDLQDTLLEEIAKFAEFHRSGDLEGRKVTRTRTQIPHHQTKVLYSLLGAGRLAAALIIREKQIPQNRLRGVEQAARATNNFNRTSDIGKWWASSRAGFRLLAEAMDWPAKSLEDEGDALFEVGPLTIHNTIGMDLSEATKLLDAVVTKIKRSPLPDFKKTLYGDVFIVGQLTRAHHAAWYYPSKDTVYVRKTRSNWSFDEVLATIHELGHRYIHKFADKARIGAWKRYHDRISYADAPKAAKLEVGEEIPLKVRGAVRGFKPVVKKLEGGYYYYDVAEKGGGVREDKILEFTIWEFMSKQNKRLNYPTPYSSTDWEEHFCEALALLSLGKLSKEHEGAFTQIWL